MSKYANCYKDAQPNLIIERLQYEIMMHGKRDMQEFGARLLAEYNARRRAK